MNLANAPPGARSMGYDWCMRPMFADPKIDFAFKKIFGSEEHKDVLRALLNALLELDEPHRIVSVELLAPEQRPQVDGLKLSIVDVKCVDAAGIRYIVEMQVLNVEGFEKRVVYNVAKAYTNQLAAGAEYPALNDVVGVTLCDFVLWPLAADGPAVPMLSRWRMQERHIGVPGLSQLQFVFLELPKLDLTREPETLVEKWAYFFSEANQLTSVPSALSEPSILSALEAARAAGFTEQEWDAYIRAGMALQDERGALSVAHRQGEAAGRAEGRAEGKAEAVLAVLRARGLRFSEAQHARVLACKDVATLERWLHMAVTCDASDALFAE